MDIEQLYSIERREVLDTIIADAAKEFLAERLGSETAEALEILVKALIRANEDGWMAT